MKRQLAAPFVCLTCRKVFKRPSYRWSNGCYEAVAHQPVCPQCHAALLKIGDTFRAPRQTDAAAWREVQREILQGRKYVRDEAYLVQPKPAPRLQVPKGVFSLFQLPARKRRSHVTPA